MAQIHNLGFPRIGRERQLKFASEKYWRGEIEQSELLQVGAQLRREHLQLQQQAGLDYLPVGDFSFYDQVLDTSFLVGNLPRRFQSGRGDNSLDDYFRVARGRAPSGEPGFAAEMTKWFDTNYHYLVPEFDESTQFELQAEVLLQYYQDAQGDALPAKPVVVGPLTYLWLGKCRNDSIDKFSLLEQLIPVYKNLLDTLAAQGAEWVQIDEPILALDLPPEWQQAFERVYHQLLTPGIKTLLATYFGPLSDNLALALRLPVAGVHLDAVRGREEVNRALDLLPVHKVLSLGVVDGRNIWKSDLSSLLDWLKPIHAQLQERLWLAPSCSLLHVPVDLEQEIELDPEIANWLAFAVQKLQELNLLKRALTDGRDAVAEELGANKQAIASRRRSTKVRTPEVQARLQKVVAGDLTRASPYSVRSQTQRQVLHLPLLPTTTIGSFPQTKGIRQVRRDRKCGAITEESYRNLMRREIQLAVKEQEDIGLDVLVHGEAERNDMVEYFGEQLQGYAFTQLGWVQSYGSRCVKPPLIFGDVSRPHAMTVEWSAYAQSLTTKPMKGMLTGPITMLQWAFVRDDQPRSVTAQQIALALRDELRDLEAAGIGVIQVDEPALREGLPLRQKDWNSYLRWAVDAFRLSTSGVTDQTQIHTHMCYAEFNDIIEAIAELDADVITIETSRSAMELLDAFVKFAYPNEIGPGVYDIHSPNIPTVQQMEALIETASRNIPLERLWINPDCGLKTRGWNEVRPALKNMVTAARNLRAQWAEQSDEVLA